MHIVLQQNYLKTFGLRLTLPTPFGQCLRMASLNHKEIVFQIVLKHQSSYREQDKDSRDRMTVFCLVIRERETITNDSTLTCYQGEIVMKK